MASGSSSSSMFYVGTTGTSADNMERMPNSQQESNLARPTSLVSSQNHHLSSNKQRNQPQASYPNTDLVVAVSPTTLLDANRYVCEVCFKGFPRNQNLLLHRRTHNLPFTFKTKTPNDHVPRKVYLCPEPSCVHHNRSHALGDFCGLRKHYLRKHCTNQKKYKCDTCPKAYSVETDMRSHSKVCAKKKHTSHCGSLFSRGNNFNGHQVDSNAQDPQTLYMGDSSLKTTRHINNNIIPIGGSTTPHPQTLAIRDNTIISNSNVNISTILSPQIPWNQNQTNSYPWTTPFQPQLRQFGPDHTSFMTDITSMGVNMNQNPPSFFSPTSTHLNQYGCQESFDAGFYADQLTDNIPLQNANFEDTSLMGDCGNVYGAMEGSSSFQMTPVVDNYCPYEMMNPVTGSSDGRSFEQKGYNDYGVGSGQLDYGGLMEVFNFKHQQQQQQQQQEDI